MFLEFCQPLRPNGSSMQETASKHRDTSGEKLDLEQEVELSISDDGRKELNPFLNWCKENSAALTIIIILLSLGGLIINNMSSVRAHIDTVATSVNSLNETTQNEFNAVREEMGQEFRSARSELQEVRSDVSQIQRDIGAIQGKLAKTEDEDVVIAMVTNDDN